VFVRECKDCGQTKSLDDFYVNAGSQGGRLARCKPCVSTRYSAGRRARQKALLAYIQAIKVERGCADCGYNANPVALDFDHLPEFRKEARIAVMAAGNSKAKIDAEIAKCEVVCANCHRIRTHRRLSEEVK
jgi:hypothetical protein